MHHGGRRLVSSLYTVKMPHGQMTVPLLSVPAYIGHFSDRCMRDYNEDRLSAAVLTLPGKQGEQLKCFSYGIYDGHGGDDVVKFVQANLGKYVEDQDLGEGRELAESFKQQVGGYWRAWQSQLPRLDRAVDKSLHDDLAKRLPLAFLRADLDIIRADLKAGTTATCVFIYSLESAGEYWDGGPAVVTVAHVGDTRALIVDNMGNVLPLTTVHHPSNPHESERLTAFSHAFVQVDGESSRFLQYTNTRAFGDVRAKTFGMSAEPDITTYLLGQNKGRLPGKEAFLVLVTDGVTDKASDQEIADLVIQSAVNRGSPQKAATEIVNYVADLFTKDNASAMVIRLAGWGQWDGWTDRSGSTRNRRLMEDNRRRG